MCIRDRSIYKENAYPKMPYELVAVTLVPFVDPEYSSCMASSWYYPSVVSSVSENIAVLPDV